MIHKHVQNGDRIAYVDPKNDIISMIPYRSRSCNYSLGDCEEFCYIMIYITRDTQSNQ